MAMGIECFRVQFPKGMDANEYALQHQAGGQGLGMLLSSAAWLGKGRRPMSRAERSADAVNDPMSSRQHRQKKTQNRQLKKKTLLLSKLRSPSQAQWQR